MVHGSEILIRACSTTSPISGMSQMSQPLKETKAMSQMSQPLKKTKAMSQIVYANENGHSVNLKRHALQAHDVSN